MTREAKAAWQPAIIVCAGLALLAARPARWLAVAVGPLLPEIDRNLRWVMDGAQSLEEVRRMDPFVDIWILHLSVLQEPRTGMPLLASSPEGAVSVYERELGFATPAAIPAPERRP